MKEVKQLPKFRKWAGFKYLQIARGNHAVVYAKYNERNFIVGYETVKITIRKESNIAGRYIPVHERFPSNSDFGNFAWSFYNCTKAMTRFNELEQKYSSPQAA